MNVVLPPQSSDRVTDNGAVSRHNVVGGRKSIRSKIKQGTLRGTAKLIRAPAPVLATTC
jgi:hypothetical protein